jgi:hypothetical protein
MYFVLHHVTQSLVLCYPDEHFAFQHLASFAVVHHFFAHDAEVVWFGG